MMLKMFNKFDELLRESDADSQDWADGGGAEDAMEYLEGFGELEWKHLSETWEKKDKKWRECLASALYAFCEEAQDLIIKMVYDKDSDVAFEAMDGLNFYCGINRDSVGQFWDERGINQKLIDKVKKQEGFKERVLELNHPYFELFMEIFTNSKIEGQTVETEGRWKRIKARGYLKDGKKDGEWIEYSGNMDKMSKLIYKKGELLERKNYIYKGLEKWEEEIEFLNIE